MEGAGRTYRHTRFERPRDARVGGARFFAPSFSRALTPLQGDSRSSRPELSWEEFDRLCDYLRYEGILSSLLEGGAHPHDLPPAFTVRAQHTERIYGYGAHYGAGSGNAHAIAIGELLERYHLYRGSEDAPRPLERFVARSFPVISEAGFGSFLPEQVRERPLLARLPFSSFALTTCVRVSTGKRYRIPGQYVFLDTRERSGPALLHPTTSGGGAYYDRTGAILSGLYEVIQRDAFLIAWLAREKLPTLDLASLPAGRTYSSSLEGALARGLRVHIVDLQRDIPVPVFACVVIDERGEPLAGVGGGSGPSVDDAIRSALNEALASLAHNYSRSHEFPKHYQPFLTSGVGRSTRLTYWRGERVSRLKFLFQGPRKTYEMMQFPVWRSREEELVALLRMVECLGEGYEVYVHEFRSHVLHMLGYRVVKVVVPALFPLYLDEVRATLRHERLAKALHVPISQLTLDMINPEPHPFP